MNEPSGHDTNRIFLLEQYAYTLYLCGGVIVGFVQSLEVVSVICRWNHDQFWWASSLSSVWIPISIVFLILLLLRRNLQLAVSPGSFLIQLFLTAIIGPFFVSVETAHPEIAHPNAHTHILRLETFDIIFSALGLFYAALNCWLLRRQGKKLGTLKTTIVALVTLGVACMPGYGQDLHVARFQRFQAEGIKLLQARDYTNALKNFSEATKEHSDSWQTWLNIGICHLRLGDYKATISDVQKSIKLGGLQPGQCTTMSGAYEGLGDPQKAHAWLELARKVEPTKADHPAVIAKMESLQDPMHSPAGRPDAPDYLGGLVSIQKWHVKDFPIKVFVRKNIQMPEFYDQFDKLVQDALNQWCKGTDNLVKYKIVSDKKSANLIFDYTERRDQVSPQHDPGIEGNAENRVRMDDSSIDFSNIIVLVKDAPGGAYRKPYAVTKTLLHEIGHALGIHGHSPNPQDVMFSNATPEVYSTLSKRDINTIRRMYNLPPADPQLQGFVCVKEKNFQKAIACFNNALKDHPNSWQILQNIGSCNMELGRVDTAIEYFEKSVKLGGLHNVSQCLSLAGAYEKAGKDRDEYEWLDKACQMDGAIAADPEIRSTMKKLEYKIDHPVSRKHN